mmetsp:Transcript_5991/g.13272  ORF Transcript_5991/g.13272 Transcript_5991/m.13272 type:complete len:93 (+) Transcript_5991:379-657(+)
MQAETMLMLRMAGELRDGRLESILTVSLQQVTLTLIPKAAVLPLPKQTAILRMPNDHEWSVLTLKIETIPFHIARGQKGLYERLEVDFRRQD